MRVPLVEIAEVIRSKNSGPFELTFDLIFKDRAVYEKVCSVKQFTPERIAALYGINTESVLAIIEFEPAKAIKINLKRPIPSGGLGDTDIYGAMRHPPVAHRFEDDRRDVLR